MGVNLGKNEKVNLTKQSASLDTVKIGLGWSPAKKPKTFFGFGGGAESIDLDASCVLMDKRGNVIDTVWFRHKESNCNSIIHGGDNRTGAGDGDDEVITAHLKQLPSNVEHLAITVNSFTGQTFNDVEDAYCRVVDGGGKELVKYNLSEKGKHTGIFIAVLSRSGSEWVFTAFGKACSGKTVAEMTNQIIMEIIQ